MLFYDSPSHYIAGQRAKLDALATANLPEQGTITKVLAPGDEQDDSSNHGYSVTHAVKHIEVDAHGMVGDRHRCLVRPSTGRETSMYPKGTIIRQHRHVLVVCSHDCHVLSQSLGVEITPELLGANVVLDRSDGAAFCLSQLPHQTHLLLMPADADKPPRPPLATLVHVIQQQGCGITGKAIAEHYQDASLTKAFREQSKHHRGILCSIEYPAQTTATLQAGLRVAFRYPRAVAP